MGRRDRTRRTGAGTPAVAAATAAGIDFRLHEYVHDPRSEAYGLEAAEALGLDPQCVFKTLVVALDGDARRLGVAIVPVTAQLALKRAAAALGARSAVMAEVPRAERSTGYVAGGISPLGQRTALPTALDDSAMAFEALFVSAGRRGLEIELAPRDLVRLTDAVVAELRSGG